MAVEPAAYAVPVGARTSQKIRFRILPFVFALFVVALIDRNNIGFAALTMNKELAITSQQFGFIFGIFFFGYFLFEIPSNLLLHRIGARVWIARILLTWGLVAMLTGFVHTVQQLYIARFLLGLAEAGYFPGIVLYLTYWFPQREQARAIALFLIGIPVTTIVGAPVSGLILDRVHWVGVSNWRWLLILEGAPAIVCGVLTYFLLPGRPQEAKFLTAEEKEWIQAELGGEEQQKFMQRSYSVLQALASGRVWVLVLIYFGMTVALYAMNSWAPQLVRSLSSLYSNSMIAAGVFSCLGPFWTLPSEFLTGYSAAAGIALINSVGNLGGFVGPAAIGFIGQRTGTLSAGLALSGIPMFLSAALVLLLPKQASPPTKT